MKNRRGIEVFNDDTIPMEKVIAVFEKALDLRPAEAFQRMVAVHQRGSCIVKLVDESEAEDLVARLEMELEKRSLALSYRMTPLLSEIEIDDCEAAWVEIDRIGLRNKLVD